LRSTSRKKGGKTDHSERGGVKREKSRDGGKRPKGANGIMTTKVWEWLMGRGAR